MQKKTSIQQKIFRRNLILIIVFAAIISISGIVINIYNENKKRDVNLMNIAESVAHLPEIRDMQCDNITAYLDSFKESLSDIDVISVISTDNTRIYHSNHNLIGTKYDGTIPVFTLKNFVYAESNKGPSGSQRRAYAAVYDLNGEYNGFVIASMLSANIEAETYRILFIFALVLIVSIILELMISYKTSMSIKEDLMGYEPYIFSSMYKIRNNILDSLDEGVVAIDEKGNLEYMNSVAEKIFGLGLGSKKRELNKLCDDLLGHTIRTGEKELGVQNTDITSADVIIDKIPIFNNERIVGAVCILHDRTEYTTLCEDLTGTRYLVDSMRANNHDFTNKMHVILGLIQMEMYDDAINYIENITFVQRETISKVMHSVDDPALAALLIGKIARAGECDVRFVLREGTCFKRSDISISSQALVTIVGNLIDNALDAMNMDEVSHDKELLFGIFSKENALLITTDDTGIGISKENFERIFEKGFSTKGDGRGTGLYYTKKLVEQFGGIITVESQADIGTSFTISFKKNDKE